MKRHDAKKKPVGGRGSPVRQWISESRYVDWRNMTEAARSVGVGVSNIFRVCSGQMKSAGGFRWETVRKSGGQRFYVNGDTVFKARKKRAQRPVRQWISDSRYVDWLTIAEATRKTGIAETGIFSAVAGSASSSCGFRWAPIAKVDPRHLFGNCDIGIKEIKARTKQRPVRQFVSDVQYVDWPTAVVAAENTGVCLSSIYHVCNGRFKTAGGFRWEKIRQIDPEHFYESGGDLLLKTKAQTRRCPVRQWISGAQYIDWPSMAEAAGRCAILLSGISNACRGKIKTAGGFRWEKISRVDPEHLYKNCGVALKEIKGRGGRMARKKRRLARLNFS